MDSLLANLAEVIGQNYWLALVVALVAGLLTSLTPCSLSTLPLVITVVGGGDLRLKQALRLSLFFALGNAFTFTVLGTMAALAGHLIGTSSKLWYLGLGVVMVLMALQTWEVVNVVPSTYLIGKNKRKGYLGALSAGILGGIFSSPCSTPVLIALLAVVVKSGSLVYGVVLLLFYSIGHAILAIVTGTSITLVKGISQNPRYGWFAFLVKLVLGLAILAMGLYMFYLGF